MVCYKSIPTDLYLAKMFYGIGLFAEQISKSAQLVTLSTFYINSSNDVNVIKRYNTNQE